MADGQFVADFSDPRAGDAKKKHTTGPRKKKTAVGATSLNSSSVTSASSTVKQTEVSSTAITKKSEGSRTSSSSVTKKETSSQEQSTTVSSTKDVGGAIQQQKVTSSTTRSEKSEVRTGGSTKPNSLAVNGVDKENRKKVEAYVPPSSKAAPKVEPVKSERKASLPSGKIGANKVENDTESPVSPQPPSIVMNGEELSEVHVSVANLKQSFADTTTPDEEEEDEGVKIDRAKLSRSFSQNQVKDEKVNVCRICNKTVFQMEKVKAEKSAFHKGCFRCKECGKQLTVDSYQSHEGVLFCKPHFKLLFQPKANFEEEVKVPRPRKHELIIKENTPAELPPDVIRSCDKPDYGLTELPNLKNIKSRFETSDQDSDGLATPQAATTPVKRCDSILSKLARFQALAEGDQANGAAYDDTSESSEDDETHDPDVVREKRKREKVVFSGMSELKSQWETGAVPSKEERAREKQEELAKLRSKICKGLRSKYESALEEANRTPQRSESLTNGDSLNGGRAVTLKDRFERGDLLNDEELERYERMKQEKEEDLSVFKDEGGTAKDARKVFKQIDASINQPIPLAPSASSANLKRSPSARMQYHTVTDGASEIVRSSDRPVDDISVDATDLSRKFKFFENYGDAPQTNGERKRFQITPPREPVNDEPSPEREIQRDPNIVRCSDKVDDDIHTDTARKMLNMFREMESKLDREDTPAGPKPLKRITPPKEYTRLDSSHESTPEPSRDPAIIRACDKVEDDFLIEAHKAMKLRAKFERWEDDSSEVENNRRNTEEELPLETGHNKILKAKFEALKEDTLQAVEKPKPKVNRFIEYAGADECDLCGKRVYQMEKLEVSGHKFHKTCFRCSQCGSILRMDNYTTSEGVLYCTPHFKQLFITKGNYDEGFGREQHKERWSRSQSGTPTIHNGLGDSYYYNGSTEQISA